MKPVEEKGLVRVLLDGTLALVQVVEMAAAWELVHLKMHLWAVFLLPTLRLLLCCSLSYHGRIPFSFFCCVAADSRGWREMTRISSDLAQRGLKRTSVSLTSSASSSLLE
jgi:hypothetical protein